MLLQLDNETVPMKLVYQLSEELKINEERIALTQALTLDSSRPEMGLKGVHGLFGSPQWWSNIADGVMPLETLSGVIHRVYISGQDADPDDLTFDLLTPDGNVRMESCYVNNAQDLRLFKVGHRVKAVYALDELKAQPGANGNVNVSEIVLEMAVSKVPALQAV